MAGFFAHISGAGVGFTCLAEATYSGVLDSIVADVSASGGANGWTVYDDQRVSGTGNFLVGLGNIGGYDAGPSNAYCDWNSGSSTANVANSRWNNNGGNGAGTELYPGKTNISFDAKNWYLVNTLPGLSGGSNTNWSFALSTNYSGTTFTAQPYYVKLQKYIVLKCSHAQKDFYVLLARPDSPCDILRVQVFEAWDNSAHSGTNGSNQEILRGLDGPDTTFWSNNWDQQPCRYLLWLLPGAFAIWAGFGAGPTDRVIQYDFAYAGNLDTTNLRSNDSNALVFACSNQRLSGFGVNSNNQNYTQGLFANSFGGLWGGARVLRTLQGDLWSMVSGTPSGSIRPSGWNPTNQYGIWPRAATYLDRVDIAWLDRSNRFLFTELDVYQMGSSALNTGSFYSEGKRGQMRYIRFPVGNPSGGHLMTIGPADDGNTYVMVKSFYTSNPGVNPSGSYAFNDFGQENKMSGFAYTRKFGPLGEVNALGNSDVVWLRWFMMPTNI